MCPHCICQHGHQYTPGNSNYIHRVHSTGKPRHTRNAVKAQQHLHACISDINWIVTYPIQEHLWHDAAIQQENQQGCHCHCAWAAAHPLRPLCSLVLHQQSSKQSVSHPKDRQAERPCKAWSLQGDLWPSEQSPQVLQAVGIAGNLAEQPWGTFAARNQSSRGLSGKSIRA